MPRGAEVSGSGPVSRPTRRMFLQGSMATIVAGLPSLRAIAASTRSLKVSTLGGYFEDCLIRFVYPEFERSTGIRIEPFVDRTGSAFADIVIVGQVEAIRGRRSNLWRPFNVSRMPNAGLVDQRFISIERDGADTIPAAAWYQTLVINPDEVSSHPTSWKSLWENRNQAPWGLPSGGASALFEITATTWFGGNDILATADGVAQVIAKIQELRPYVKLWWDSEGMMESAYVAGDVAGGMYFNDVARLMARNGASIMSIFPTEGAVIDFASWCQPASSTKIVEAELFVDFMCMPTTQATIARKVGAPPIVDRRLTDLTDAEFAEVASDRAPIAMAVDARLRASDLMNRQFLAMLTS